MFKRDFVVAVEQNMDFGSFLRLRRDMGKVTQKEVLVRLDGWTQSNFSRLEGGLLAPAFDQLQSIYKALWQSGVLRSVADRDQFIYYARQRIEEKKSHYEHITDAQWADLRYQLAQVDLLSEARSTPASPWTPAPTLLPEIRHL